MISVLAVSIIGCSQAGSGGGGSLIKPVIIGVSASSEHLYGVTINVTHSDAGVICGAAIDDVTYNIGTYYNVTGSHTIVATAYDPVTGYTSQESVDFVVREFQFNLNVPFTYVEHQINPTGTIVTIITCNVSLYTSSNSTYDGTYKYDGTYLSESLDERNTVTEYYTKYDVSKRL